ncbi:hypothetical protein [Amnibacterium setariae]|uniref:Uncharacterized protein n=1 Tax=Amnibacterium setariae TaxID=2306585 RepID=A0A3A1U0U8_9MICO|nr:hypothetical protein [Amnibacterium setariae]RIX29960.1 hypothetical protein D1781_00305 [Amnibacterium setariae]
MVANAVEVNSERPATYGPERTIRFFLEYSAPHPLWFWFDYPDLAALQLPADLAHRLQRWSVYWDSTFHWDDGWPAGTPEQWWEEEESRLPRDVAITLGSDFVIEVDGQYVHSTKDAGSPTSAAAVHALIDAEVAERQRLSGSIAAGAQYDVVAGDTSYRAWLADRQSEEPPIQ